VKAVRAVGRALAAVLAAGVVVALYLLVLTRGSWQPWNAL
jgi:hypothetical protein